MMGRASMFPLSCLGVHNYPPGPGYSIFPAMISESRNELELLGYESEGRLEVEVVVRAGTCD